MSEFVHPASEYEIVEAEPPELLARNLNSAAHLLASATAFFFLAFVFAYFYLRSLNNAGLWHPKHVAPSQTLGALILACTLGSALLVRLGVLDRRAERRPAWRLKGSVALALGVAAVVLQVIEWATVGFGPADGGYASVFVGWTAFWVLFAVGGLFWLETLLANSFRYRNLPLHAAPAPGEASGDPHREGHDIAEPLQLVLPGLEAFSFFWIFLAGVELLAWILLYVA